MLKAFNRQSRLVQVLLLLVPVVNWITEIVVRTSALLEERNFKTILGFILGLFLGFGFGWLDLVWVLLFNKLFLT